MKLNKVEKILLIICVVCTIIIWSNQNRGSQEIQAVKMEAKLMLQIPKFSNLSDVSNVPGTKEADVPLLMEYQYEIIYRDKTIQLLSYTGNDTIVFVPKTIDGIPVSTIGEKCFYNNNDIEQIILPVGITKIERGAFSLCTKLEYIIMEEGIEEIKMNAISDCPNLKELHLPEGLISVEDICANCQRLEKVYFPQSLKYIGRKQFTGCTNLKVIYGSNQYAQACAQRKDIAYVDLNRIQEEGNVVW